MLLNARQMAYLGLLLAICEVLLYLSAVLSINTLALLFLAACCVGVACALSSAAGGGVFCLGLATRPFITANSKKWCRRARSSRFR